MRYPVFRTRHVGSATPGAVVESHQLQFSKNPGPSGPEEIAESHSDFARRKFLPGSRGNPRKWGPGPTPPVRGRWPEGPEGVGWATMSTKCSSGAVPGGVLGYLSRTPGEAQRSGFAGKRRSKEAVAVFAARRKRRQADFATTSRRGQSHSPPAGGEIPRVQRAQSEPCPLIRHGFAVPPFPIPSVASRHHPYPFWPSAISP